MLDGSAQQTGNPLMPAAAGVRTIADLAQLLRDLRRRHARRGRDSPLTYREMAGRTGWSPTAIAEYFTAKTLPPTDRFDALVALLGATPAEQGALAEARDRVEENRRARQAGPGVTAPEAVQDPARPGSLFQLLRDQVEINARHAVDVYAREVDEYRSAGADSLTDVLDFAVFIRRRTLDLAAAERPLSDADLSVIASAGRRRAELGLSVPSQQKVLSLHTTAMLREVHDMSRPDHVNDLLRIVSWFGPQGIRARQAYLRGYMNGVDASQVLTTRTEFLARALLSDEPVEPILVGALDSPVAPRHLVSVLRFPPPAPPPEARDEASRALARRLVPVAWLAPDELVLLTPGVGEAVQARALDHVRLAVKTVGRPCQAATVDGRVGSLADSLTWAREASVVAPMEDRPARLHAIADLFVELSVTNVPRVDSWLRAVVQPLAVNPELVATLDALYLNDLDRTATATALNIQPGTVAHRLEHIRTLTGVDPISVSGVRLLSTAVARIRARGWT
ncbi:helix-turn-helix domain-containing protein [Paractinoplanes brasiliensis]|uniref:Helix-turn-helix protein n=1 Tax=Paractinoplanes brasiliensis TaxID=52695 RepID=A0A4R6JTL4_9ACTN|nr:helix-turn-helix domain-containing protein [Actinoplanes brasiliensis]TDO38356.1 helix-turn-helix protein [Actinoplanes brasiliensis]GID26867.1 hypothetical protein Abr02nite_18500 [Actinoplanes brasiliensis]